MSAQPGPSLHHISADQATAYLAARPEVTGRILTQEEAIEIARNEFGPLLGRQP